MSKCKVLFNVLNKLEELEGYIVVLNNKDNELINIIVNDENIHEHICKISENAFFLSAYYFPDMTNTPIEKVIKEVYLMVKNHTIKEVIFDGDIVEYDKLKVCYYLDFEIDDYYDQPSIYISPLNTKENDSYFEDKTNLLVLSYLSSKGFSEAMESCITHENIDLTEDELIQIIEEDNEYIEFIKKEVLV